MVDDISGNLSDFVVMNNQDFELIKNEMNIDNYNELEMNIMNSGATLAQTSNQLLINLDSNHHMNEIIPYAEYIPSNTYLMDYPGDDFPPTEPKELCNLDYAGPYNFEVLVDPDGMKNPWEYSAKFNKMYIDIMHKFPVNFSVKPDANKENDRLFIRATPMYEEDRYFSDLVHRCISHEQPTSIMNQGIAAHIIQHVMRCDNANAKYCGSKEENKRLSVIIPLGSPQAGTDSVKEFFQFVCKSSCPGGMNRRPIQVIFTLEDNQGDVLGRRVLCVRICSCPRRDREKDETKKEKQAAPPQGKKRKMEKKHNNVPASHTSTGTNDVTLYHLSLNIVGEENYRKLIETAQALMSAEIVNLEGHPKGTDAPYRKCLTEIRSLLNKGD